jgi:hypothetical protein
MTRALKPPSETGQFCVGKEAEPEESLEVMLRKSSGDPVERHWPMRRTARCKMLEFHCSIDWRFTCLVHSLPFSDVVNCDGSWGLDWCHCDSGDI